MGSGTDTHRLARRTLSRRRLLQRGGQAGLGLSALGLTDCAASAIAPTAAPQASGANATPATAAPAVLPAPSPSPGVQAPKYGGTATFSPIGDAPHLDIHATNNIQLHSQRAGIAYSRVLWFKSSPDRKGTENTVEGDLAESWTQPDETTLVVKLRGQGVKFQNIPPVSGRELVADDVLYSFGRQKDLKANAANLPAYDKLEAVDKYTLKFTLPRSDADFLAQLTYGTNLIVAHEAVDLNGDLKNGPTIGTGAYILEKFEPGTTTTLTKNPDYFRKGLPYVDRYEALVIADDQTRLQAFRTKQILLNSASITLPEIADLKKQFPELKSAASKSIDNGAELGMRVDRPPFNDKRVRQAVSKALDRQAIIDVAYQGGAWHTSGTQFFYPDWAIPEDEIEKLYARDVEGAKKLLADAGFANGIDVEMIALSGYGAIIENTAQLVQSQLRDANIRVTLKPTDSVTYTTQVLGAGNFQMYTALVFPNPTPTADLRVKYLKGGSRNGYGIDDPQLQQLADQQAVMRDLNQRKQAVLNIQRYLIDQAYVLSLATASTETLWWPTLGYWGAIGQPVAEFSYLTYIWINK